MSQNNTSFEKIWSENYPTFYLIVLILILVFYLMNRETACTIIDIKLTDIATQDPEQGWYVLNEDYTITECQRLFINGGTQFRIEEGQILTNLGTIVIVGANSSIQNMNLSGLKGGTLNNIGSLTISDGAYIINKNDNINGAEGGTIINSGSIVLSNTGYIDNSNSSHSSNLDNTTGLAGGIIKNTGTIIIEVSGEIDNRNISDNHATNYNATKGGIIYIYGGGKMENYGTIHNGGSSGTALGGTISRTVNDSSVCGVGTLFLYPTGIITEGIFVNVCPPTM